MPWWPSRASCSSSSPARWPPACSRRTTLRLLADVLVPDLGMRGDEAGQQLDALGRRQIHDLDAALAKPVDAAGERDRLAHHHLGDAELADEAAAVPARGKRRHHHRVAIGAPAARAPERVGLSVKRWILLLDAPVVSAAQQRAVGGEERRPDRDAALGKARPGFLQRDLEHLAIGHGSGAYAASAMMS